MNIIIENPLILILGAFFSVIPFKKRCQLVVIQKLILFYLACVLVNLVSDEYFTISVWRWSVNISWGFLGVILLSGMFFLKKKSIAEDEQQLYKEILSGWWIVLGIIATHTIILFFILKQFYGYGYEHSLNSMGAMCGYFILFVCLWRGLSSMLIRWLFGGGFIIMIGVDIILKGGVL